MLVVVVIRPISMRSRMRCDPATSDTPTEILYYVISGLLGFMKRCLLFCYDG